MINLATQKMLYILRYKPFTYLLVVFMIFYMAEIYPQSCTSLPTILGLLFQNQLLRLIMLIVIIYISQYNFYLSSIITLVVISSYLLSGEFNAMPIEGFKNKTKNDNSKNNKNNDNNNNNDSEEIDNDTNDDKSSKKKKPSGIYNPDADDDDDNFIDLDDSLDQNHVEEKLAKITKRNDENKDAKTISQCIDLISTLPSDGDDTYKEFLQNVAAQRKAYIDTIKNKSKEEELNKAKNQYRKMLKYVTEEFLENIDDEEEEEDDE
jgi:hypothetical protein